MSSADCLAFGEGGRVSRSSLGGAERGLFVCPRSGPGKEGQRDKNGGYLLEDPSALELGQMDTEVRAVGVGKLGRESLQRRREEGGEGCQGPV